MNILIYLFLCLYNKKKAFNDNNRDPIFFKDGILNILDNL